MSFLNSLNISGSALTAQRLRIDTITQNIVNSKTTMTENGTPYTKKLVVLEEMPLSFEEIMNSKYKEVKNVLGGGVKVREVIDSEEPYGRVYDPSHPHAGEDGYVLMPNVNVSEEQVDLMAATRAYEANITALNVVKAMATKALEIGK